MSSTYATILILCMAVTALIPRLIPAVLADKMHFGAKTEKFLKLIPYTAMAALIFPGVLTVDSARPHVGLIGAAVAAVLAEEARASGTEAPAFRVVSFRRTARGWNEKL